VFEEFNKNLHGAKIMQKANTRLDTLDRFWFFRLPLATAVALFLALTTCVRFSFG
jgi:hypothetical protein